MGLNKRILGEDMDRKITANADKKASRYGGDLDAMAKDWAEKTRIRFMEEIKKKKLTVTEDLLNSIKYTITDGEEPSIKFTFAAHGAFVDMKEISWNTFPPVEPIKEWVLRKGVNKFKYVPGYENGKPMDNDLAASRIAWGIIKSRDSGEVVNQYGKWKRKKSWQQPALGKAVALLGHLLAEELADEAAKRFIYPLINS